MHRPTRIKITDLNPHLMCVLCGGYYMDATTVIECLHSFCKSCIVRYLETSKYCPICDVQIHKTKPLLSIRSDQTLQEIVYKLVPGLFQNEMKRRRDFYAQHPQEAAKISSSGYSEERGEVEGGQRFVGNPDESINFSLEYSDGSDTCARTSGTAADKKVKRYLHCPTAVTVSHLKKLVRAKYGLPAENKIEIMCSEDCLDDDFSLMDISYIYSWKRVGPLRLFYRIYENVTAKRFKITDNVITDADKKDEQLKKPETTTSSSEIIPPLSKTSSAPANEMLADNEERAKNKETAPVCQPVERKRSTSTSPAIWRAKDAKRKTKRQRIRNDEAIVRAKALFLLPPPASSTPSSPRENGEKEDGKKTEASSPRLNGDASTGGDDDTHVNKKTSADKENKLTDDKEITSVNPETKALLPEKMNRLTGSENEKKLENASALGKT